MIPVLVDTSIWIEFFQPEPALDLSPLELLLEERRVATCLPIRAEVLSGEIPSSTRSLVERAFEAMTFVDPDWRSTETWGEVSDLAQQARRKHLGVPGLVDRMILITARNAGAPLWTRDKKLLRLAHQLGVPSFQP